MTIRPTEDALLDVVRDPLAAIGLDPEAIELSTAGRRRVVRVLVDRDGGVTLDELGAATGVVGDALDRSDLLGDRPYTLEVTSPGVDRPLTAPRHWRRNVDRLVSVALARGGTLVGRIRGADDDAAILDVDGATQRIGYAEIESAQVQVEFKPPRSREEGQ